MQMQLRYFKRVPPSIENEILAKNDQLLSKCKLPKEEDLKVYFQLDEDMTVKIQPNGKTAMTILSYRELLSALTSGNIFSYAEADN